MAIIRQSTFNNGAPFQQLSNLCLTGINTSVDAQNTDGGKLYGSLTYSAPLYTLQLYKDSTKLDLVASGTADALGPLTLNSANASGLAGTVNLAQFLANDNMLEVWCVFSVDSDLPMANLDGLNDYDATVGFAAYHIQAFNKIVEVITSRFRSNLWNPTLIDANSLNGALGGWDLARFNNLQVLRDPARYYAFMRICERQTVEPGSIFDMRQKEARTIFKAHMESQELTFDVYGERVDGAARTLSTFSTGR